MLDYNMIMAIVSGIVGVLMIGLGVWLINRYHTRKHLSEVQNTKVLGPKKPSKMLIIMGGLSIAFGALIFIIGIGYFIKERRKRALSVPQFSPLGMGGMDEMSEMQLPVPVLGKSKSHKSSHRHSRKSSGKRKK